MPLVAPPALLTDGVFSGDTSNVMRWVAALGVLVTLAAGTLLVRFLAGSPDWRASKRARWILFIGLLGLPAISLVLGNSVGYHHANATSCLECHVMAPWVGDLQNPQSQSLAARHWRHRWINQNACYTCHRGYGVAGTITNKLKGVSHVWNAHIGSPPDPIVHDGPYPMETCLTCHGPTPKFRQHRAHTMAPSLWQELQRGQVSCFECHAPPHPRPNAPPFAGPYREAMCLRCHGETRAFTAALPHTLAPDLWAAIRSGERSCRECHAQAHTARTPTGGSGTYPESLCLACHGPTAKFRESPSHADDMVRDFILSGELACAQCHDADHPRMKR